MVRLCTKSGQIFLQLFLEQFHGPGKTLGFFPHQIHAQLQPGAVSYTHLDVYKRQVHAIDPQDPHNTDQDLCISCMRCVSICPQSARKVNPVMLAAADLMLKKVCTDRKEGELYI